MDTNLKLLVVESSNLVDMTQVQIDYWVIDLFDKYQDRYILCCEHLEFSI